MGRVCFAAFAVSLSGCSWWAANGSAAVRDVVSAASFACVESSGITDAKELATACLIVREAAELTPAILLFVDKLIAQRETLKTAGYHLDKPTARWVRQ